MCRECSFPIWHCFSFQEFAYTSYIQHATAHCSHWAHAWNSPRGMNWISPETNGEMLLMNEQRLMGTREPCGRLNTQKRRRKKCDMQLKYFSLCAYITRTYAHTRTSDCIACTWTFSCKYLRCVNIGWRQQQKERSRSTKRLTIFSAQICLEFFLLLFFFLCKWLASSTVASIWSCYIFFLLFYAFLFLIYSKSADINGTQFIIERNGISYF